jgi:nitrogen fixation protein FixH
LNHLGPASLTKEYILKKLLMAASIALSASLAFADGVLKPQHGGVMAEATSGHRVELVGGTDQVMVYLTDHDGNPVDSNGVTGDITLLSGTEKSKATLTPAGNNQLTAKAKALSGTKAIVKVTLPGKPADQMRLILK